MYQNPVTVTTSVRKNFSDSRKISLILALSRPKIGRAALQDKDRPASRTPGAGEPADRADTSPRWHETAIRPATNTGSVSAAASAQGSSRGGRSSSFSHVACASASKTSPSRLVRTSARSGLSAGAAAETAAGGDPGWVKELESRARSARAAETAAGGDPGWMPSPSTAGRPLELQGQGPAGFAESAAAVLGVGHDGGHDPPELGRVASDR